MANTCPFRHQKGCQSGDYPGHDEDRCAENPLLKQRGTVGAHCNTIGHVEKTSDRDYEVEERSAIPVRSDDQCAVYTVEGARLTYSPTNQAVPNHGISSK